MTKNEPRLPHFLRFTRALALVSGAVIPAALAVACGGAIDGSGDEHQLYGIGTCTECAADAAIDDDAAPGVRDAGNVYDGAVVGVQPYDGGPMGSRPYDGGPVGVSPDDGGGGVMTDASADSQAGGGPLIAPELPA